MAAKLLSMTGYGEAISQFAELEWRCVVQSVNSRNLDARFRLPASLQGLEIKFRKLLQKVIARGKVDVVFSFSPMAVVDDSSDLISGGLLFNSDWVADFCRSGENLFTDLDWQSSDNLRAALLQSAFSQRGAFSDNALDLTEVSDPLLELLQSALGLHLESREQEGENLAADFFGRLSLLKDYISTIADKAAAMPEIFKERIGIRLDSIIDNDQFTLDPARVTQEIAHLIDKADISEEIVRFNSHIEQIYLEINDSSADRKGKKLEFIVQEMLREINTVGSKANLLEITQIVVDVKNELEKIREQVQNIV